MAHRVLHRLAFWLSLFRESSVYFYCWTGSSLMFKIRFEPPLRKQYFIPAWLSFVGYGKWAVLPNQQNKWDLTEVFKIGLEHETGLCCLFSNKYNSWTSLVLSFTNSITFEMNWGATHEIGTMLWGESNGGPFIVFIANQRSHSLHCG